MKFTKSEDVEMDQDALFAKVSNFSMFERLIIRRGVSLERVAGTPENAVGMAWDSDFQFRGKKRSARIEITEYDAPNLLKFHAKSQNIEVRFEIDLTALSAKRTRMAVTSVLDPKSLSARLFVQSMKLGRSKLNKRYSQRVRQFASELESSQA